MTEPASEPANSEPGLRVVLLTTNPDILDAGWGAIIRAEARIAEILVCAQKPAGGARAIARRLRKNLAKHGPLFLPYRLWALVAERPRHQVPETRFGQRAIPVKIVVAPSIHADEVLDTVRAWMPDIGLSIGAPVLRASLFTIPRYGTFNIHCGELPDFRGAPPAFWELASDASRIGATFHRIDTGLDTGKIVERAIAPLYATDTLRTATDRAFELGRAVLERGLSRIAKVPEFDGVAQEPGGAANRQPLVAKRMALGVRITLRRARRLLAPRSLAKGCAGVIILAVIRPIRDAFRTLRGRHPVRIFTYHRVTDLCQDGMTISVAQFDAQVKYICKRHEVVSLDQALASLGGRGKLRKPLCVIAFDDAYKSVYTHAAPILGSHNVTATCFAATGFLGTDKRYHHDDECAARDFASIMTRGELRELRAGGWVVGSHTVNHVRLSTCDQTSLDYELGASKTAIEQEFGHAPIAIAYPFGSRADISEQAVATIKQLGYVACLGDFGGENFQGADLYSLNRIDIGANHSTLMWKLYAHGFDLAGLRLRYSHVPSKRG